MIRTDGIETIASPHLHARPVRIGDLCRVTDAGWEGALVRVVKIDPGHKWPYSVELVKPWKGMGVGHEGMLARNEFVVVAEMVEEHTELSASGTTIEDLIRVGDMISKRHPNSARFHELLKEIGDLHDRKQADYGKDDDPFANVRASVEWDMPGWVGAMLRLTDKVRRLQAMRRNGKLANESATDSFLDIAVYALIALVLYEQEAG